MPTYVYKREGVDLRLELVMTVAEMERRTRKDYTIKFQGHVWNRDWQAEHGGFQSTNDAGWPIQSDAAGCHPCQIQETERQLKEKGVVMRHTRDGRAVFTSPAHRRKCLKAMNIHDRCGFD